MSTTAAYGQHGGRQAGRWVGPAAAFLFGLLAALPLWLGPGFLNTRGGGDSPFLLFRLHQLMEALGQGVFPVRWMPDAALGLGYPFFNYYAALPYFVAAGFKASGLSYVASLVLAQTLGFGLAGWGMYAWMIQAGYPRPAAWLGSAAYTFAPFHIVNVYVRGDSLSEFWAFAWYPLILLAALRLARRPSLRRMLPLALAYAALVLTHNISALIFTPFLVIYLSVLLGSGNWRLVIGDSSSRRNLQSPNSTPQLPITNYQSPISFLALALTGVVFALALAAFFWLPALLEGSYGQLGPVTQGYFNYSQHFRGFNLVQTAPLFNYEVGGEAGASTPFAMGLAQAALMAGGLVGLFVGLARRRATVHDLFAVLGLAGTTFMITPLSRPLWDALPLLPFVQFPWRFLSVQSLFVALVTSRLLPAPNPAPSQGGRLPLPAIVPALLRSPSLHGLGLGAVLALTALPSLRLDFIPMRDGDVTAQRLQLYEYFTGNLGTTIRHEYLPRGVVPTPFASDEVLLRPPRVKLLAGDAAGTRTIKAADRQEWQVTVNTAQSVVAFPLNYWPGWTARLDGETVPVAAAPGLGWLTIVVPRGEHAVSLQLGRTFVRGVAEVISLLAWLLLAVLGLRSLSRSALSLGRIGAMLTGLLLLLLLAGTAALLPRPAPSILRLSADFDQLAYFNSAPIRFADGAALTGYDYSADRLARSQTLAVTSLWAGAESGPNALLELVTPPAPLREAETVYASVQFQAGPVAVAQLGIPAAMPPGVYLLRLRLESAGEPVLALTPADRPRGALYLRPVWIDDPGPAALASGTFGDFGPALRLAALNGTQASLDRLEVRLTWQALADAPQNYALALRLNDGTGAEWAALDTQPAQGFYPTGMWRAGEVVPDRLHLRLPIGTPPGDYSLTVTLYDAASLAPLGRFSQPVSLTIAAPATPADVAAPLIDSLGLAEVEAPASLLQGEPLDLTAHWVTLGSPPKGLRARWSLVPEAGGETVDVSAALSTVADPADWPAGSLILGRASLPTPADLAPGRYSLSLALLDRKGEVAARADGLAIVEVLKRGRLTAPPGGARTLSARFGDSISLEAYDLEQNAGEIVLTAYWRARTQPPGNFKFFVHLFDPNTEAIAAQHDGFPHAGAYPTNQWAAGEVVSDVIHLSLAGVPPGAYRLALGWYDPEDPLARLPAADAEGQPLELDRLVLPDAITVR